MTSAPPDCSASREAKKSQTGVVVYLKDCRVRILASDVLRPTAARIIRLAKRKLSPLKFFPVSAREAERVVDRVNRRPETIAR